MVQLGLADECCEGAYVRLIMMQSTLCAHNTSSQLVSNIKGTFAENLNVRIVTQVSMETQGFPSAKSPAQGQQYKIVVHARHKLRTPFIHSHTIKQRNCNTSI